MLSAAAALPSSWEELPPDILGLVLLHLPSLSDRVRLRAVCRPWRAGAAAQQHKHLPPPLPWFALRDGSLVSLNGAPVRCGSILREGVDSYLAVDNLALLVHDDCGCSLVNPLSGLTLPLPGLAAEVLRELEESSFWDCRSFKKTFVKVALSSAPDPHVAVIFAEGTRVSISACKRQCEGSTSFRIRPKRTRKIMPLGAAGLGPPDPDTTKPQGLRRFDDIAFLHDKLYALTCHEGLRVIYHDACHLQEPKLSPRFQFHNCIGDDPTQQQIYNHLGNGSALLVMRYLVESNGRLLMMRRWMTIPKGAAVGDHDRTIKFEVFEADLTSVPGRWVQVDSLYGHAIFIDSECSKSVPASRCAGGVLEDCIYFMHRVFDNPSVENFGPDVDPLADSGVYNVRDRKIMPLLPEGVMAELQGKRQFMRWFFPADSSYRMCQLLE